MSIEPVELGHRVLTHRLGHVCGCADGQDGGDVGRRALDQSDVRAQLRVFPPDPKHKLPNGEPYPETVLLRLIDPNGRPSVKLATDVRGGGLYLGGPEDPTMARLGADGAEARLELVNKDRREKVIRP